MATVLTGALMFESLGHPGASRRLEDAVRRVLDNGPTTPDIGGSNTTHEVAAALLESVG